MRSADQVEAELVDIVRKYAPRNTEINRSTAIYHDLQIVGDDADELLREIADRFGVSTNVKMDFATYFPMEPEALYYWVKAKLGFPDNTRPRVTIEHLIAVAERGCWFDPPGTH